MALTKLQKQKIIENLKEKIEKQKSIVFVDFSGVGVKELSELRRKMRENNNEFKVAKKTLVRIALGEKQIKLPQDLPGEVALGFGYEDEISPFKILGDFSRQNENLKIIGGFVGEFIGEEKAKEIAQLSSKEELLAKMVGSISAPISNLVNILEGNIRGLVSLLSQIKPSVKVVE